MLTFSERTIDTNQGKKVLIIDFSGKETNEDRIKDLASQCKELIWETSSYVVLNFEDVTNGLNSMTIGSLIIGLQGATAPGPGDICLVGLNDRIRDKLHTTKLDQIFKIFNTIEEGIQNFERYPCI